MKDSEIEYVKKIININNIIFEHYYEDLHIIITKDKKLYMIDHMKSDYFVYNVATYNLNSFIYHDKKLYYKRLDIFPDSNLQIVKLTLNGRWHTELQLYKKHNTPRIEKIITVDHNDIFYINGYKIIINDYKVPEVRKDGYFINNLLAIAKAAEDIKFSYE